MYPQLARSCIYLHFTCLKFSCYRVQLVSDSSRY
uniref:Uncharacterized protein n=1 Tax=Arundo donax TaxID=35708 RepID=A0A0A8ZII3_ARUDO